MIKHLSGSFTQKLNTSKHWTTVHVPLYDIEVHYEKVIDLAARSQGYFTEIADDRNACIRFELPEDAAQFKAAYDKA